MELREEFVGLALTPGANVSDLCRRFGIDRGTGHKWLKRYKAEGSSGLADRSRRPHASPSRSEAAVEAEVLRIRAASNNAWGGRKIAWTMSQAGCGTVPATSTISDILRRHGKLDRGSQHPGPHIRFERADPNALWQMDFKGHFPMANGRCHPLTVLDDHSRYSLGIEACGNEQDATVRSRLTTLFRRYGLPFAMLMDNGPPWGDSGGQPYTAFTTWLIRHGVAVSHGRPYHPQTQGKVERFHRSLKAEVLERNSYADLLACQRAFDRWRQIYNCERPHEAPRRHAAGQPLPPKPAPVQREAATDRLWIRRHRPQGRRHRRDQLPEQVFQDRKAFPRTATGSACDIPGWAVRRPLLHPAHRTARPQNRRRKNLWGCGHRKRDAQQQQDVRNAS